MINRDLAPLFGIQLATSTHCTLQKITENQKITYYTTENHIFVGVIPYTHKYVNDIKLHNGDLGNYDAKQERYSIPLAVTDPMRNSR